jgi:hypothetical protein
MKMAARIRYETVTFRNEFSLSGIERMQPPGRYEIEIEEELITELSFPAYRRSATVIRLPSSQSGRYEAATVDPLELDAALERDGVLRSWTRVAQPSLELRVGAKPPSTVHRGVAGPAFLTFSGRLRKAAARLRLTDQLKS